MKRNTVAVDCEEINPKIKENGWSNASFSRLVGKYPSWYGEVKRGNNLPSPEEAAKMCILLQTTPEEILLEPEDIALVNDLLEQEKGAKKAPGQKAEGEMLDIETQRELVRQAISNTNDLGELLDMMDAINRKIRELK